MRLLQALHGGAQDELASLKLGGNAQLTDGGAGAAAAALARVRPDLRVEWAPQLEGAQPCCHVGTVYKNSPAARAGLMKGDAVLQWGMLQKGRSLAQRFGFQPSMQDSVGEAFLASCEFQSVARACRELDHIGSAVGSPVSSRELP